MSGASRKVAGGGEKKGEKMPKDTPFLQQRLPAWQPILTPKIVIAVFIAVGVAFIPTGVMLMGKADAIYEDTIIYDNGQKDSKCPVNTSPSCKLVFTLAKDIDTDLHVYYQLTNFYQNHRIYVASKSNDQLRGLSTVTKESATKDCGGVKTTSNSSLQLNPCGLIANSFFSDTITLTAPGHTMSETGISWPTDKDKFIQPFKFQYQKLASCPTPAAATAALCTANGLPSTCKFYSEAATGSCYLFYYPDDASVQYLYESYPTIISPIQGVTNEHFMVWMRTAALPTFRKLYGIIKAPLKAREVLTFTVNPSYEVASFKGSKGLIISTVGTFGGKNVYLGAGYIVVGGLSLLLSCMFIIKYIQSPREIGKRELLTWSQ